MSRCATNNSIASESITSVGYGVVVVVGVGPR